MEYEPCLQNEKRSAITKISGPDGLEAWFVALAACFINFVMAGLGRMSGILYVAFIDLFHTDRRQASLPFSIRSSTRNLLGPVVGILGQKYGVRPVVIVGGIIGTVSAASCFYLDDFVWITVVWGFINGVGTSLTTTLPQVVIGQHFKKYRSTASGMAFSGGCVGSFLFPALMEYLLYTYGIGGTFLLIAGIIMHVIPAALILKIPSWWKDERKPEILVSTINGDTNEQKTNVTELHREFKVREKTANYDDENLPQKTDDRLTESNSAPNNNSVYYEQTSDREQIKSQIDTDFLWENRDILIPLLTSNFTLQYKPSETKQNNNFRTEDTLIKEIELFFRKIETNISNCHVSLVNASPHSLNSENEIAEKPAQLKNIVNGSFTSKEVTTAINFNSINSILFYLEKLFEKERNELFQMFSEDQHGNVNRMLENLGHLHNFLINYEKNGYVYRQLPNNSEFSGGSTNSIENGGEHSNTFFSHIKTAFKLHRKPIFLLICLCRSVHFLTFMPVVTTIVDFSMDKGLPAEDGKYVIAALSLGDLMGRLCLGWITDRGFVSLPRYMLFVMILQGASTVALSFMQSRGAIMSSIAVFGLLQGSVFVRHPVLVSRYLGSHEQSIAMGCINFFSGLLGFLLPLYIGYFRDTIGSYNGIFYINGSIGAFIGTLWLFEPYFLKLSSRSHPSGDRPTEV